MNRSTVVAFVAVGLSALIGLPALAERPSINMLNAAVNQLEAENNAQQAEIDALRAASLRVFDVNGLNFERLDEDSRRCPAAST